MKNVAVIGSGLAGLSAAWLLSQPKNFSDGNQCHVELFEKSPSIGMDAASVDIFDGKFRVDVPMRGFFPGYYPTLVRLYKSLGIHFKKRNHTVVFCRMNHETTETVPIFSYENVFRNIFGFGIPLPNFHKDSFEDIIRLSYDWCRFFYRSHQYVRLSKEGKENLLPKPNMTIHEYLQHHNYSKIFMYDALYAMLTGLCTCPYEDCMAYPASIVLEFYGSGVLFEGTSAVTGGVQEVCKTMSASIPKIHLDSPVTFVERFQEEDGEWKVRVGLKDGVKVFDAVIFACQANHALAVIKDPSEDERKALGSFKYVKSPTYVHTDKSVMASDRKYWRGLNVVASSKMNAAMSTMYMNDITPDIGSDVDIFQTVTPHIPIKEECLLSVTHFERAVVNKNSVAGLKLLNEIQGTRNTYFVGSYAFEGIPLLEGCICSALNAAEKLGMNKKKVTDSFPTLEPYHSSIYARIFFFVLGLFNWLWDLLL